MIWAILILALILRLVNLNQSLWLDEAAQILMSQSSLYTIIFERSGDFHPPLSYILYHFWMMLGTSEIWLRLLPVLFGVTTVFVIFKLCLKLFNKKIALTSALFLAIAQYHVYYSQELRMYSIVTFFAALSMYFLVTKRNLGYILSTSAFLYTHYMGIFLLVAHFMYKRNWKLLGIVLLTYIPWLPLLWHQLQNGVKADEYLPGWDSLLSVDAIKAIPTMLIKFSIGRINFDNQLLYLGISCLVLILFGYLIYHAIRFEKQSKVLIYWLFIPIIITWIISFFIPMNQPFRLLFTIPAFCMLLAVGVNHLGRFWKMGLAGVLCISFSGLLIYYTNPKFQREDWRTVAKEIPENAVFAWPVPFDPYIWYGGQGTGVVKKFPASIDDVTKNMDKLEKRSEVYLFEYLQALSDPERNIQKWLGENGYILERTLNYNGVGFVYKYIKK